MDEHNSGQIDEKGDHLSILKTESDFISTDDVNQIEATDGSNINEDKYPSPDEANVLITQRINIKEEGSSESKNEPAYFTDESQTCIDFMSIKPEYEAMDTYSSDMPLNIPAPQLTNPHLEDYSVGNSPVITLVELNDASDMKCELSEPYDQNSEAEQIPNNVNNTDSGHGNFEVPDESKYHIISEDINIDSRISTENDLSGEPEAKRAKILEVEDQNIEHTTSIDNYLSARGNKQQWTTGEIVEISSDSDLELNDFPNKQIKNEISDISTEVKSNVDLDKTSENTESANVLYEKTENVLEQHCPENVNCISKETSDNNLQLSINQDTGYKPSHSNCLPNDSQKRHNYNLRKRTADSSGDVLQIQSQSRGKGLWQAVTNFGQNIKRTLFGSETVTTNQDLNIHLQSAPLDSSIQVVFHVFISRKFLSDDKIVYIVFGEPIGDWNSAFVQMQVKNTELRSDRLVYLSGSYAFERKYCKKPISYRYVISCQRDIFWEQFSEDYHGNQFNRFVQLAVDCTNPFNKYDDCITNFRTNHNFHTQGRQHACAHMAVSVMDFQQNSFESVMNNIETIYKAYNEQWLINREGMRKRFGLYYRPDLAIQYFLDLCQSLLNETSIKSFQVAAVVTMILEENSDKQSHEYKKFGSLIKSVFETFKNFICKLDSIEEIRNYFQLSSDFKPSFLIALVNSINLYLSFITRCSQFPAYPCVYAYSLVRSLQDLDEHYENDIRVTMLNGLKAAQKESMNTALVTIRSLPKTNPSFKNEYLELCSPDLFSQLLESEDLPIFNSTSIFKRFCLIYINKSLGPRKLANCLQASKSFFHQNIPNLSRDDAKIWMESIRDCLSSLSQINEFLHFFLFVLTLLKDRIERFKEHGEPLVVKVVALIKDKLVSTSYQVNYEDNLKQWCELFNLLNNFSEKRLADDFITLFKNEISKWPTDSLESQVMKNLSMFDETIFNLILDVVFNSADKCNERNAMQNSYLSKLLNVFNLDNSPDASKRNKALILSRLISSFPVVNQVNEENCFKMFLQATGSDRLIKILTYMPVYRAYLTSSDVDRLTLITDNLELFIKLLDSGELTFKVLKSLSCPERTSKLIEIQQLSNKTNIGMLIKSRLEEFDYVKNKIDSIKRYFSHFNIYLKTKLCIESYLDFDEENHLLKTYCDTRKVQPPANQKPLFPLPRFRLHSLNAGDVDLISTLVSFLESVCFVQMLRESVCEFQTDAWELSDALTHTKSIVKKFANFCKSLSDGSISLNDIQKYFSKHQSNESHFKKELCIIEKIFQTTNANWTDHIFKKIQLFFTVSNLKAMSETLLETINVLQIDCDPSFLLEIISLGGDSRDLLECPLNFLDDGKLQYNEQFNSWNQKLLLALTTLNKCVLLIEWVKKNIESVQALKVFIDLANISAGETDIEVDRVLCFQSAVMACSGLLFDCRNKCGLKDLLEACSTLNNALERGEDVSKKLSDSNRYIRWLDSIKDRHGSVETSSLNLVRLITQNGEIIIRSVDSSYVDINITFEEMHDGERHKQTLSLENLKELESKLMLISASQEVKSQVDKFTSVLHEIILIEKSVSQLLTSGCCLFSQLSIRAYFGDRQVTIRVDFGHTTGILTGSGNLEEELFAIISCFDDCVSKWDEYIMAVRSTCHLLNFYTTDQLVTLSRLIAYIETERDYSEDEAMMLLRLLSRDITLDSVKDAVHSCMNSSNNNIESEKDRNDAGFTSSQAVNCDFDLEIVKETAQKVSGIYGLTEANVLACILQTRNVSNLEEICNWCMQNEDQEATMDDFNRIDSVSNIACPDEDTQVSDSESVPTEEEQFASVRSLIAKISEENAIQPENVFAAMLSIQNIDDEDALVYWCFDNPDFNEEISIEKLRRENLFKCTANRPNNEEPMVVDAVNNLEKIKMEFDDVVPSSLISTEISTMWEKFLDFTSSDEFRDFVTFKRLNEVLEVLYERHSILLSRKFPPFLETGRPNLIVVKESDIHQIALMLYQFDEGKCLPSLDEILVCDYDTTLEQMTLHCLRAFNDRAGKIYTFLHAERINFNNSCHLEKLFCQPVVNHNYRLVFLSSKEDDKNSYMSNALLRFKVNVPKLTSSKDIRSYLCRHLKNTNHESIGYNVDPSKFRLRIVSSERSGEGKSLVIRNMSELGKCPLLSLSIHSDKINTDYIVQKLFERSRRSSVENIFHIDLCSNVVNGVQDLLFSLAVMAAVRNFKGQFWICSLSDYYAIEMVMSSENSQSNELFHNFLPVIWCNSPKESLNFYESHPEAPEITRFYPNSHGFCHCMDYKICGSHECQRPYQYLDRFVKRQPLDQFMFATKQGSVRDCLNVLLSSCCVPDPTWTELSNFWKFLNVQLKSCESSVFCKFQFIGDTLPGFKTFVVEFLIQMSEDFSTRSAVVSDESMIIPRIPDRNSWENNFHPYLFFNADGNSLCFFGFKIVNGNLIDDRIADSERIIKRNVMNSDLFQGLSNQKVNFNRNMNVAQKDLRKFYLGELCKVFGLKKVCDCDRDYELTEDNVLKMLAIHMRFRADIPVMIMGETGTGKTRLIRFMCDLQKQGKTAKNMVTIKCHGGIEVEDIYNIVHNTIDLARSNFEAGISQTVLFFDEANTTNAIGAIKEVMCDRMVNGESVPDDIGLKFIAAVNPYREHTAEMITKLENAGLGYHIKAENTEDKLGRKIPMRRLVYRVKELPPSILPLIWDFGKLDSLTERKYIVQMVQHRIRQKKWSGNYQNLLVSVLTVCQEIMRERTDECSFVSLRDVDRCLEILSWFSTKRDLIINSIKNDITGILPDISDAFVIELVLAVACSYYVRLEDRSCFFEILDIPFAESGFNFHDRNVFNEIIDSCQDLFIKELRLESTISKNEALKENIWIMAICIELKIPLFLVGKPGSSKSLAKTLVADAMQGEASYSPLFKHFKEIQLVSFQCSPLATADGILSTFRQCQTYQKKQNLNSFTAVVVLDEIGLAEDSSKMPLKTLHPLLEDGCIGDETPENYKKVGFVGISNWALDPAKMNRGIFVSRGKLSRRDLLKTARGICPNDGEVTFSLETYLEDIVDAYQYIYENQKREYYGLRDFYNLIKMLHQILKAHDEISIINLKRAIYRCFGGCFDNMNPSLVFLSQMSSIPIEEQNDRGIQHFDLVKSALSENEDNRYLLLLTKNNAALRILLENQSIFKQKVILIYGSSFPLDQEYVQLCKNINRIKLAMEMGHTVILCNLDNLYESLYDALNQSYVYMGGCRYVDLGLGMHRVKCRVHHLFRLIVVAEDIDVFERFPIPLINRLEKHYLGMESLMTSEFHHHLRATEDWISRFCELSVDNSLQYFAPYTPEDVFIGFHKDVPASLILQSTPPNCFEFAKRSLINCASPDSISRLESSNLNSNEIEEAIRLYYQDQEHTSLATSINSLKHMDQIFLQVTTHSRLLTISCRNEIASHVGISHDNIKLISLHQFETEEQFRTKVGEFLVSCSDDRVNNVLVIQCSFDNHIKRSNLIECARYCVKQLVGHHSEKMFAIVLVIQIPRSKGENFVGFSFNPWICVHLDEIHCDHLPLEIYQLRGKTTSEIFEQLDSEIFRKLLIEACSESCTKIESTDNERVISKMKLLLNTLNDPSFGLRFSKITKAKLIDYEKKVESQQPTKHELLVNVSLQSIYLREGHTFHQTLWLTLLSKIVPFFAKLIKKCDLGQGLQHLVGNNEWVQLFFIRMLENLDFDVLIEPQLPENFSSLLPFSWAISDLFERIYSTCRTSCPEVFYFTVKETMFGSELKNLFELDKEAWRLFANDLISMKYAILRNYPNLLELLIDDLVTTAQNKVLKERIQISHQNESNVQGILSATDLYLAFLNISTKKLKTLVNALNFCEKIYVQSIVDTIVKVKLATDKDIDRIAIETVMDKLEPNNLDLSVEIDRKKWTKQVKQFGLIVQCYLAGQIVLDEPQLIQSYHRLDILNLFTEYVVAKQENEKYSKILKQSFNRLRVMLKPCNLKESSTFSCLVKMLSKISADTGRLIFSGGVDKCFVCNGQLQEPVDLPCHHVACSSCLRDIAYNRSSSSTDGKWNCPFKDCKAIYSPDFRLESSWYCQNTVKEHKRFRENMNLFFLEVLQRYTFCGDILPEDNIIETLIGYVVTQNLPTTERAVTRNLSPFSSDFIDSSPTIRSFIFRLILKGRRDLTRVDYYLNKFCASFSSLLNDNNFKSEFCLLLLYSIEDYILSSQSDHFSDNALSIEMSFVDDLIESISWDRMQSGSLLYKLELAAKLRILLSSAAQFIHRLANQPDSLSAVEMHQLERIRDVILQGNQDCLLRYLSREIVDKYSRNSILEWKQQSLFLDMMHKEFRDNDFDYQPDFYTMIGPDYRAMKLRIGDYLNDQQSYDFRTISNRLHLMNVRLACFYFKMKLPISTPLGQKTDQLLSKLNDITRVDCIHKTLLQYIRSDVTPIDKTLFIILNHLSEMLRLHCPSTSRGLIDFFISLCWYPDKLIGCYFPTMPQDDLIDVLENMHRPNTSNQSESRYYFTSLYRCSNGHPYGVADCGALNEQGRCPCGAKIGGGTNSQAETDFHDNTQSGHILGSPLTSQITTGVRELNSVQVSVLRFFIHASMFLSNRKRDVSALISPQIADGKVDEFLLQHLRHNFIHLSSALGKSEDYANFYLHMIIDKFTKYKSRENPRLTSKIERIKWESEFSRATSLDSNMESHYDDFQNQIKNEAKGFEILFEKVLENETSTQFEMSDLPFVNYLWMPRFHLSLTNINQKVDQNELNGTCPLLSSMIRNETELSQVHHLVSILKLQSTLVSRFNKNLDFTVLENKSIQEFLSLYFTDSNERNTLKELIIVYLNVLNHLRNKVFNYNEIGRLAFEHYLSVDPACRPATIQDTRCGILFPSKLGFGLWAVVLVQMLIDSHNAILRSYLTTVHEDESSAVSPCIVDQSQLVTFQRHHLEMLLLLNSNYNLQSGRTTELTIDLQNLERQIESRFFVGRVLLDNKQVPELQFNDGENITAKKVQLNIGQRPLPSSMQYMIESDLTSLPDLCLFLSHCQTLRSLLAITINSNSKDFNINERSTLKSYINILQYRMPAHIQTIRLLDNILLEYMDDLIIFLKMIRAKRMVLLKQNPWQGSLNQEMQVELSSPVEEHLNNVLHHIPPVCLLSNLCRFIDEYLVSGHIDNPQYPISDCIYEFLYEQNENELAQTFQTYFSPDVLVMHASSCFSYFVSKLN